MAKELIGIEIDLGKRERIKRGEKKTRNNTRMTEEGEEMEAERWRHTRGTDLLMKKVIGIEMGIDKHIVRASRTGASTGVLATKNRTSTRMGTEIGGGIHARGGGRKDDSIGCSRGSHPLFALVAEKGEDAGEEDKMGINEAVT
eukprot:763581-Hanusia_phi.AAC.5